MYGICSRCGCSAETCICPQLNEHVKVWRFSYAPAEFKKLSPHEGDEDWVALVPEEMAEAWIPWLEQGNFGNCVSTHKLHNGSIVVISAHGLGVHLNL